MKGWIVIVALLALLLLTATVAAQPVPMSWIAQALPVSEGERYYDLKVAGDYILGYAGEPVSPVQTIWYQGRMVVHLDQTNPIRIRNLSADGLICGSVNGRPIVGDLKRSLITAQLSNFSGRVNAIVNPRVVAGVLRGNAVIWQEGLAEAGWEAQLVLPDLRGYPNSVEIANSTTIVANQLPLHSYYGHLAFIISLRSGEMRMMDDGYGRDLVLRGIDGSGNIIGTVVLPPKQGKDPQGFFYDSYRRLTRLLRDYRHIGGALVFPDAGYVHPTAIVGKGTLYGYYGCNGGFPDYKVWEKPFILNPNLSLVDFGQVVGLPLGSHLTGVYGSTSTGGMIVALAQSGDDYKKGPRRPYLLSRGRILPTPPAQ